MMSEAAETIKGAIKEALQKKGSLPESRLMKIVAKRMVDVFGEGREKEFKNKFDTDLFSLVSKNKVVDKDGVYSLFEKPAVESGSVPQERPNKRKHDSLPTIDSFKKGSGHSNNESVSKDPPPSNTLELWKNGEMYWKEGKLEDSYLRNNPDRITRLFCGNLNKKVTEEELKKCISGITHIKWVTDKESGEFYGSSFIEMKDAESAAAAIAQDKSKFMGRPLKIFYCPPRPGDVWPPKPVAAGGSAVQTGPPRREKQAQPPGGKTLFAGNLSYNIDDDTMVDFFKSCGSLVGLRWLTHQDSGEFKGCGYVEFSNANEAAAALKLDGKELLGRNIRLDWAEVTRKST